MDSRNNHIDGSKLLNPDTMVDKLQEVVNIMDVDTTPPTYQISDQTVYIVLDTNILLGFLDVIKRFADTIQKHMLPALFIIPGIVIDELDNQKERRDNSLSWSSRRASAWLWEMLRPRGEKNLRRYFRGQSYSETLQRSGKWKIRDGNTNNDDLIVDCCLFFSEKLQKRVISVSADYNLCTKVSEQGVYAVNPRDKKDWSARDLAAEVFGPQFSNISIFSTYLRIDRPSKVKEALEGIYGPKPEELSSNLTGDEMEIDDDRSNTVREPGDTLPSHILDRFHLEIIEYFSPVLLDITKRHAPELFDGSASKNGSRASIHSPYNPNKKWNACECAEYLTNTRSDGFSRLRNLSTYSDYIEKIRKGGRELGEFLMKPYEGKGRRGQDWTQASWESCMRTLYGIGVIWENEQICSSLQAAWQELGNTFNMTMKPTGM